MCSYDQVPRPTKSVKAVASAIWEDRHLESLMLKMDDGFTDGAGVALVETLTVNKTLHMLILDDNLFASDCVHTKASLGAQAFRTFISMLRVNASLMLDLPKVSFDDDAGDRKDIEHFKQMLLEQRLNEVGRGKLLASS
jgi:hypothetical protein